MIKLIKGGAMTILHAYIMAFILISLIRVQKVL